MIFGREKSPIIEINFFNITTQSEIKFVSYLYLPNQPTPININEDSYLDLVVHAYLNYNVRAK